MVKFTMTAFLSAAMAQTTELHDVYSALNDDAGTPSPTVADRGVRGKGKGDGKSAKGGGKETLPPGFTEDDLEGHELPTLFDGEGKGDGSGKDDKGAGKGSGKDDKGAGKGTLPKDDKGAGKGRRSLECIILDQAGCLKAAKARDLPLNNAPGNPFKGCYTYTNPDQDSQSFYFGTSTRDVEPNQFLILAKKELTRDYARVPCEETIGGEDDGVGGKGEGKGQ